MKNQQRFAEIEYCLDKYFQTNLAPVMSRVQQDLTKKQLEEYRQYKSSFAGILADLADASHGIPGLDSTATRVKLTGKWNSKTVEDYLEMCQKDILGNKTIQKDMAKLAGEWRGAVVGEIGRARYDQLSKQLGCDLAYAYVDYRVQQQMVQHMVNKETPKSTADYIMRKAASDSLIGLGTTLQKSPLAREISDRAEKAYNPSTAEKAAARGASFGIDVVSTGCLGSWASVGKFAATEIVFDGVEWAAGKLRDGEKAMTVEECISQAVFSSQKNVFPTLRKQGSKVQTWDNDYIKSVNNQLGKKMGIATTKPALYDIMEAQHKELSQVTQYHPYTKQGAETKKQDDLRKKYNIPSMVAPGKEEEYIKTQEAAKAKQQAEAAKAKEAAKTEDTSKAQETTDTKEQAEDTNTQTQTTNETNNEVQNPTQDNSNGWEKLLEGFGLNGLGDIGHNLGYIISMLPDILVGMWTGKTKSLGLKDNLIAYASVLAGMFVKNPIMKMLLIGMGGANLLNKAGHEALGKADGENLQSTGQTVRPQYLHYADQPLNPRISNVTLSGSTLIATIDKVPCTVCLTPDIVDAYHSGALPLNTLANAILERNEQRQAVLDNNYERLQEQQRQQQVVLK